MSEVELAILRERVDSLELQLEDLRAAFHNFRLSSNRGSATTSGYHVVSSAASDQRAASVAGSTSSAGYNALAGEIPEVPDFAVRLCSNLRGSSLSSRDRAVRAWEAGHWAKFCIEGRVSKPRPTVPVDLPNAIYVVLQAEGILEPAIATKASDYRALVKDFTGPSVSHGFPSQAEARVYCLGAGVEYPSSVYKWSPSRSSA